MIGKNIRRLRQEMEMSQQALATVLNVTQGSVSQWEKGMTNPDTAQLIAIARFFGVSIDALLNEDSIAIRDTMKSDNDLSKVEFKLIADFRSLTREGKEHVLDYMGAMLVIYKKHPISPNMEKRVE